MVNKVTNKIQLDTSGLLCPEPVMLLHKTIRDMATGDMVEVIATDPSTERDIPKFCHFLGHTLKEHQENENNYYYLIEKK
jgi:tRNA 2-thiouridine synthesizing protein A